MGKTTKHYDDGSYTDRHDTGQSITYNSDGSVRENSKPETSWPIPDFLADVIAPHDVQVTRDGDGKIINIQRRK